MKIVKYSKLKDNIFKVIFDNGVEVNIYDDVIIKYNLLSKKELSKEQLNDILVVNNKAMAYYDSLKYISKKLRTEKDIKEYLGRKEYEEEVVHEAIEKLRKDGYLNDKVYIQSYIDDQIYLGNSGPQKIKDKLVDLGLNEEEIDNYLANIKKDIWLNKLRKLIDKKIKTNHKLGNERLKEKIIYDLVNMGYSKDVLISIIDNETFNDGEIIEKEFNKLLIKLKNKFGGKELELQLINRMMNKGFNYNDIKECIKKANLNG